MSGRPVAWTPGNPVQELPVVLPADLRSKGRVTLPSQLFDRTPWLAAVKQGALTVAIEIRAAGRVRIVPREWADKLLASATDAEVTATIIRRTFVGRIGADRRLSLPDILAGTVLPEWPTNSHAVKVLIECHESHFDLMTADAWLILVKEDPDLEALLEQSDPER